MAEEAGDKQKRQLEADTEAEAEPAAKRVKTDAEPATAAADTEQAEQADGAEAADDAEDGCGQQDETAGEEDAAEQPVAAAADVEQVKLGYRTFKNGQEASDYISGVLKRTKPGQDLNEVRSACDYVSRCHQCA